MINNTPTAAAVTGSADENSLNTTISVSGAISDLDINDILTITADTGLTGWTATVVGTDITFTAPVGGYEHLAVGETAMETFSYIVSDGNGGTATNTATVTITGSNDAPSASAVVGSAGEDTLSTMIDVSGAITDVDLSDALTISADTGTTGWTATIVGTEITFTAPAGGYEYLALGETATETFNYTVSDGHGGTATNTATVTITGANDAPVVEPASGLPTVDELPINTTTQDNHAFVDVAPLSTGGFVMTWQDNALGAATGSGNVLAQMYDATGQQVGSELQLNTEPTWLQALGSVTGLDNGGFVATWLTSRAGSGVDIAVRVYDAAGQAVSPELLANTHLTNSQYAPSVADLADGGFVVTWGSSGQDADGSAGVYGQRYTANGQVVGSEFQVNTYTPDTQSTPSVSGLPNGGFVVTWQSNTQDGGEYGIYGQVYDAAGQPSGSEFQVNTYTSDLQTSSFVTSLSDGGFMVTWQSYAQDGSQYGVYGQKFSSAGLPLGDEFQANTHTSGNQSPGFGKNITALPDGEFVVTWNSYGQDGDVSGVYGQIFDAAGLPSGNEFRVNTTTSGDQNLLGTMTLPDGSIMVVYSDDGEFFAKIFTSEDIRPVSQ